MRKSEINESDEESDEETSSNHHNDDDRKENDEEEIPDFDDLEADIIEINKDESEIQYTHVIKTKSVTNKDQNDLNEDLDDLDDDEEYNLDSDKLIKDLKINLGSADIPRYQCANHKLDIVGRKAVRLHRELRDICRKLNRSNARCRKVIKLSRVFRKKKCRLRLESKTRWSTFYLLLLSAKKAYDKGAFNLMVQCPISLQTIETYLQILKPLYLLNVSFQSDHSAIADVIPGI